MQPNEAKSRSLEELQSDYKEQGNLMDRADNKCLLLVDRATKLAGLYLIFQGTMFHASPRAAVSKAKRWISASLSALGSVAFWTTFSITVREYLRMRRRQDSMFLHREKLYRRIRSIQTQTCEAESSKTTGGGGGGSDHASRALAKALTYTNYKRRAFVGSLNSVFITVSLLVPYALVS